MPAPTAGGLPAPGPAHLGHLRGRRAGGRVVGGSSTRGSVASAVPTCGVAGVTVVAERRGGGLLRDLFAAMLGRGRRTGASRSRRCSPRRRASTGASATRSSAPTTRSPSRPRCLGGVAAPAGVTTRRARLEDVPAVRATYDAWAAVQNGPLTRRRPPSRPPTRSCCRRHRHHPRRGRRRPAGRLRDVAARVAATTAVGQHRGRRPRRASRPTRPAPCGGCSARFASVTGSVRVRTSGSDVTPSGAAVRRSGTWSSGTPTCCACTTSAAALTALPLRGPGASTSGSRATRWAPWTAATGCGSATAGPACERGDGGGRRGGADPAGAGAALRRATSPAGTSGSPATSRGGSPADDDVLDALLGGRQLHIRDYF